MTGPAIELRGVRHAYADGAEVLHGIDLTVERGEVFGFLGHNGAGKTTAMNILTTLLVPTGGEASVCGYDVVAERGEVTRRIGYLPADVRLYGHLTATREPRVLRQAVRRRRPPRRQPRDPRLPRAPPTWPTEG